MKLKIFSFFALFLSLGLALNSAYSQESGNLLYRIVEIMVQAGDFTVAGDLYIPLKGDQHPAVVWVHGSGPLTRQIMAPLLKPQIDIFLKAGFAFFLDDIPGAGASKGNIQNVYQDRALILIKEIEALKARTDIFPERIGVAGTSQAGIVMPLATTLTTDVAFMIAEACVAEAAYRQDAYLLENVMICDGHPADEAEKAARFQLQRYETEDYQEYLAAVDYLSKNDVAKLIGLDAPGMDKEKFKRRDLSSAKLGSRYDPMPVVAGLRFPILAMFGEKDKNINSFQAVEAYQMTFRTAGNKLNQVEMIPNANHCLYEAETGCVRELMEQVQGGMPLYGPLVLGILADWLARLNDSFSR